MLVSFIGIPLAFANKYPHKLSNITEAKIIIPDEKILLKLSDTIIAIIGTGVNIF